jgi:hypothetical protein
VFAIVDFGICGKGELGHLGILLAWAALFYFGNALVRALGGGKLCTSLESVSRRTGRYANVTFQSASFHAQVCLSQFTSSRFL